MNPQLDAFVDYQIFCDGIRSRINPDGVNPALNAFLAKAVNEARWSTLAIWLQHRLIRMVIREQSSHWSTGLKKLLAEMRKEVAWFEPDLEVMFNVYQDVILDEFGAAPVSPPTAFIADLPFPSARDVQHVNDATIHLALTAIRRRALAVRRHTQPQAMQQWQMFCEVYLAWKGGWAAFGLEDKVALVRELEAVWAQMPTWTMALPLSLVCLDRVKAGHDMNIILHANPQLQPHGHMSPHAHLVLQPGDSDPQAAPHSHQGVSASSYDDFSNPAFPQHEAGLVLTLDPPSPHTLPAGDLAYPQQTLESHQGSPAGPSQFLSPNQHEPHHRRRPTLRSSSPAPQQHSALPDESLFGGGYHSLASVKHRLGRDRAEATRTW
ncbi:hypothetical protein JCM11641_001722 [Rhodosporidiobolus odoratus]